MSEINLYPEMDAKIVELLRFGGRPSGLYAAARIEELERQLREEREASALLSRTVGDLQRELAGISDVLSAYESETGAESHASWDVVLRVRELVEIEHDLERQLAEERQARQEAEAACAMMRQVLNEFIRFNMDFVKATIEIFPGWDGTIESNTLDKYKGIEARVEQALALDAGREMIEIEHQLAEEREKRREAEAACAAKDKALECIRDDCRTSLMPDALGYDQEAWLRRKVNRCAAKADAALALDAGRQTAELLREALIWLSLWRESLPEEVEDLLDRAKEFGWPAEEEK